jgi:MoxR-like ATPase
MLSEKKEWEVVCHALVRFAEGGYLDDARDAFLKFFNKHALDILGKDGFARYKAMQTAREEREKREEDEAYQGRGRHWRPVDEELISEVKAALASVELPQIYENGFDPCLDAVVETFRLAPESAVPLRWMTWRKMLGSMQDVLVGTNISFFPNNRNFRRVMRTLTGFKTQKISELCADESVLNTIGLTKLICGEKTSVTVGFDITSVCEGIYAEGCQTPEQVRKAVLREVPEGSLTKADFTHVAESYETIRSLLSTALAEKTPGVNILLYGPPGTGKTEMAKTLAAEIGAALFQASSKDKYDAAGRLDTLALAQRILENDRTSMVLFDEAEDVFKPFSGLSKMHINNMLETNKTPVVWITNAVYTMDAAYLRRYRFALELPRPGRKRRNEIWAKLFTKSGLAVTGDEIANLAERFNVEPAIVQTGIDTAKLSRSDHPAQTVAMTIEGILKAQGRRVIPEKIGSEPKFVPALLNTDQDLSALAEKLAAKKRTRFSFCLYGAPGTGKSAFARHLAQRLGMDVIQKRASDLMGKYVGETEKNIAAAFAEAKKEKALLVFDEADSFLRSRKLAIHSWEVSAVNEMLTQMESAQYPFVCTTNLMDDLDEASLRRFTFKVKYGFLKVPQVALAFEHFFGIKPDGIDLSGFKKLAPGDFTVVKANADILDTDDPLELVKLLKREQAMKEAEKEAPIGF